MQKAITVGTWIAIILSCAAASADVEPAAQFAGRYFFDVRTGNLIDAPPALRFVGDVYENSLTPATGAGSSSTALDTIWGDAVTAIDTGTLEQMDVSLFNSSSSGNTLPVNSINLAVQISRAADASVIGGFSGNVNLASPLSPGFFAIITFTNLSALPAPIVLDTTDLLIDQQRLSHTGGSIRMGIAHLNPIHVGSSPASYRVNGVTTTIQGLQANPGYRLQVVPEPASVGLLAWGALCFVRPRAHRR